MLTLIDLKLRNLFIATAGGDAQREGGEGSAAARKSKHEWNTKLEM